MEGNMGEGMEKRRYKRIKADLKLNVSSLFQQNNVLISNIDSPINVVNVSKGGISFTAKSILPIDFYFNAALQLGDEEDILFCVVKIIRCMPIPDSDEYSYGCQFVGMAPVLDYIFDEYEEKIEKELENENNN